jgi:hypothetical protein
VKQMGVADPRIKPVAVLDTNVFLSIATCLDAAQHYAVDPFTLSAKGVFVRQRIREAIVLSQYLHDTKALTYCLEEAHRVAFDRVDPTRTDRLEHAFTYIWLDYVLFGLLPGWQVGFPSNATNEPRGSAADSLIVEKAKEFAIPVISYEGFTPTGLDESKGLRKKALAAGVTVVTPAEFYNGADESVLADAFYNNFRDGSFAFARSRPPEQAMNFAKALDVVDAYYRHVLYGEARGHTKPVPVKMK